MDLALSSTQPWDFFGRNDAKAETPVLWPPHAKSWLIGKDSDVGRDWGQEEKGTTEDEMAGWHHWLDARESEWTPGVGDGQGGLACCDSWGRKESDTTERLNWTELSTGYIIVLVKFPNTCPTLSPYFDLGVYLGKGWSYRAILAKTPVWSKMDYNILCDTPETGMHGDFTHRLLQTSEWLSNPISPTNMSIRKKSAIERGFPLQYCPPFRV